MSMRENIERNVAAMKGSDPAWLTSNRLDVAAAKREKAKRVAEAEAWIATVRARRK